MHQPIQIHPVSFIKAMSSALELSANGISRHHHRTAIISKAIAQQIGLPQSATQTVIYAALLHDIGAAADWDEKHYIVHTESSSRIFNHAEKGYQILRQSPQLSFLAEPVRHHHDRFQGGNPTGVQGADIPLAARIIHLADRIEVEIDHEQPILMQRQHVFDRVTGFAMFDPELLAAVRALDRTECFWLDIVNATYERTFLNDLDYFEKLTFTIDDLLLIAQVFANVVDETSHYTAEHSKNVARLASLLARRRGFSEEECKQFQLAGLLHDIGKLAIPNAILDKPGTLTDEEFAIIRQHPYYSNRILSQVDGFERIAAWVGCHHETMDGEGYPFHLPAECIELGARILAAADVFTALMEDRPYRAGLTLEQVFAVMDDKASRKKLDAALVADLHAEGQTAADLVFRN